MNCKATTRRGQVCKMKALKGDRFCFSHSASTRQAQAQARRLGGENSHTAHAGDPSIIPAQIESIQAARKILDYVLLELLISDNGIQRNRALLALFDSFCKSLEIGELEQRIAALEAGRK